MKAIQREMVWCCDGVMLVWCLMCVTGCSSLGLGLLSSMRIPRRPSSRESRYRSQYASTDSRVSGPDQVIRLD